MGHVLMDHRNGLVRESDFVLMTRAGAEIGVASTKAFGTQLSALALLVHDVDPPGLDPGAFPFVAGKQAAAGLGADLLEHVRVNRPDSRRRLPAA